MKSTPFQDTDFLVQKQNLIEQQILFNLIQNQNQSNNLQINSPQNNCLFMNTKFSYTNPKQIINNSLNNNNNQNFQSFQNIQNNSHNQNKKTKKNSPVDQHDRKNSIDEDHNCIDLEILLRKKDKRTTIMIRHIPNKYNIGSMLDEINVDFKGKYDLFYLPIDYINSCNLGFAFINFVDPMHIILFYELFRGKRWKKFNSEKICELAYAKFQGKKDLIAHFEKGSVMNFDTEDKKPLILPTPNPLPKIEIPLKLLEPFNYFYPYALVKLCKEKFTVESFYNF